MTIRCYNPPELTAYKAWLGGWCTCPTVYRLKVIAVPPKRAIVQPDQACTVFALDETGDTIKVVFDEGHSVRVTPGQSCVFYQDDICLGGGVIQTIDTPTSLAEV